MLLLAEFLLRLSFGLAGAMAVVPPKQVTSGYFRNHLYVTLGLCALAALLCRAVAPAAFIPAVAAAVVSYVGSVFWLYEKPLGGMLALVAVAGLAYAGSFQMLSPAPTEAADDALRVAHMTASGATLGFVMAAMLLGHWYLNAPGMALAPLRRLIALAAIAVLAHAVLCCVGLAFDLSARTVPTTWWMFVALRWLFGLAGVVVLLFMAWRTLDVPNTQSATGILYVAVIGTFVGETMSLLLSRESVYPL
jgi:hypothetical protein